MLESFHEEVLTWISDWPDGLIAVDSLNCIVFVSDKAVELLGWNLNDVKGKDLHSVLCVNSRGYAHSKAMCPLNDKTKPHSIRSSLWLNSEGFNVGVDFRQFPIKGSKQVDFILSFQSNIEAEYSQLELEKHAEYVDKNPEPIVEFDAEGQMLFSNSAMQEQIIHHGFNEFGETTILPSNLHTICGQCAGSKEVIRNIEVEVAGGWFRWQFHPIESLGHTSVMAYAFDITEQKDFEQRIAAEKTEARRDFFAKMVHELRTPLNAIIGFSQVLLRRTEGVLEERDLKHLKSIRSAGLQLNEMISDTLDISKIDAGKMSLDLENFHISRLIDSFGEQMQSLADAKSLVYLVSCSDEISIYSDLTKFRQILVNLISNAIKYTPEGYVRVSVEMYHSKEASEAGAEIKIEVTDSGIGIPQDQIDSLFRAYQQVSEEKNKGIQGTGLGLALVSELAEMLKGRIDITSVAGEGSTFSVILPQKY